MKNKKYNLDTSLAKPEIKDKFDSISSLLAGNVNATQHLSTDGFYLEKAPNAVTFIESEKFLAGPTLFPVQYEICRDFFELLCPHCNDIERIHVKNDVPREDQILFEYDTCPNCHLTKESIADDLKFYNELIGIMGMRSGKSALVACMSSAIIHELLCIDNLQDKLGLMSAQTLEAAFLASTGKQAAETVYGHFNGLYLESPWFQNLKNKLLRAEINGDNYRRGDLYSEGNRFIHYKYKNIYIQALNSNSGSLAGRTRIFAVVDELSRFDAGESKRSAMEVYRVMKRSLLTVKNAVAALREKGIYNIPDARMFCISSPLYADDMMMTLEKQAKIQNKMFAFRRATWEANPTISKEDLADEYAVDPLGAERDYGANPPGAENPLITDPKIIDVCIDQDRKSILEYREKQFDTVIQGVQFNYISMELTDVRFKNLAEYVVHCDPGKTGDSFCLAIGHLDGSTVVIDGALEARPIPKGNRQGLKPREIHFPSITDIILSLSRRLALIAVTYDRWNSAEQIDKLRDSKILAIGKNIDRDDHMSFVNSMRALKIRFPKKENDIIDPKHNRNIPCAKALWELSTLNDNGVKVDHPMNGSSDMIQCYVGVHRMLVTPEKVINKKDLLKEQRNKQIRNSVNSRHVGRVVRLRRFV